MKQDSVPKTDKGNKVDEEHIHQDGQGKKSTEEAGLRATKNDASDRMEEELIRQDIGRDAGKNDTRTELG
jgi:hypothetical protein